MRGKIRNTVVGVIASRHIAGGEITDALPVCRWAAREGFRLVISPWAGPLDPPAKMLARYTEAIDTLNREQMDFYLSVKLDSIGYDEGLFRELLGFARAQGVRVHLDSLGPEMADTALSFLERGVRSGFDIGYTLPARWERSLNDAERIAELGVPVRIVKGQWPDPGPRSVDCRRNYLRIATKLAGTVCPVGVATHDISLARSALKHLSSLGVRCELEQFFSLPLNGVELAQSVGCPYRIYVAYGFPGIPYNIRFTLTRPGIAAWVLADFAMHRNRPWSDQRI